MRICLIVFLFLYAAAASSVSLPRSLQSSMDSIDQTESYDTHGLDYVKQPPCLCSSSHIRRSHQAEVSMSPGEMSSSPSQNASSSQTTSPNQEQTKLWPPTMETVLTATFRVFITILSLLNVNFTWRLHGKDTLASHAGFERH